MLEARDITKVYRSGAGDVMPLKGVNVDLMAGELTLLMGPSGSGKTTLLSILGCILSPTSGTLRLAGIPTKGLNAEGMADLRRKHVGFVFQAYNLVPTLTALENVMLALDLRGASLADAALPRLGGARRGRPVAPRARVAQQAVGRREAARVDCPCAGRLAVGDPGRRAHRRARQRERPGA